MKVERSDERKREDSRRDAPLEVVGTEADDPESVKLLKGLLW